jgi:diguanylate cyclase (GGDEF)-like protein
MKQYGFVYNNFEKLKSFIYSKNIRNNDNILIQVFTGIVEVGFIENIIGEILYLLPQAEIVGATTAGEIFEEKALTNTTIISFTIFEKTKIKSKLLNVENNNEYELGVKLVEELVEEDTKVLMLFSDGLLTNSWDIIKGIQAANSKVIICGGKAGDNGYLKETFVFTKAGITPKGVAAVSLTGKQLSVITEHSFGWSTIGKLMTITKAENNRIYTIDNVKAVDVYKKYLGEDVAKGLPMSATEFPLVTIKDGVHIARVAYSCNDDGSLSFLNNVEVNDKVQFGYGNINTLIDQSLEIANRLKEKNVEAIFIYSCSVRRSFMQDKVNLEIDPLSSIAPTFGFFTYGEFCTMNNTNKLLNISMTVLGISEGEQSFQNDNTVLTKSESSVKSFFEGKDLGVIKAFSNLVKEATKELQETNEILEKQKAKIEQMNNITKSILQINSEMIFSGEADRFLQSILDKALDIISSGRVGSILLLENNILHYKAAKGYNSEKIKDITYRIEDIYEHDKISIEELFNPIILTNLKERLFREEHKYNVWRSMVDEEPRELLTCGIGIDGEIVGLINIFNTNKEESFSEEDKSLIKYLCYDIAIALKNFRLLENIIYMSRFDGLTGVYNRNYFRELLNKTFKEAKVSKTTFVVCMMDLNNFKIINDTYGHDVGDGVLVKFANIFKRAIDKSDILGRIGGDEFTAVFINKNKRQVIEIINRISNILKNYSLDFNGEREAVSFAYGLYEFSSASNDIDELLKVADKRMYEKKRRMKEKH